MGLVYVYQKICAHFNLKSKMLRPGVITSGCILFKTGEKIMFTNKRYITCGISSAIPDEIQLALWTMIDNLKASTNIEVDYLQIFRLSNQNGKQKIIHRQEQPAYCNEILVAFIWNPVENAKIFVVDDGTHSTMMLAEEY
jgi:hypothetical protein